MALQMAIQPETTLIENGTVKIVRGFACEAAYIRVGTVSIIGKNRMTLSVLYFPSAAQTQMNFHSVDHSAAYDILGDNPIRQAYLHLKTLPEFAGATDC